MSQRWRTVGLVAGVVGALVAGTAIGAVTRGRAQRRRDPSRLRLGDLAPDRESAVAADDGLALSVAEFDPLDGEPELTVIFAHGFLLDRRMWHFQRTELPTLGAPRVRTVLYDHRSHGRSGRSTRTTSTIGQLGRDLAAVIAAVAPDGPVVLVGHSMGAMTIMALAEQRPELFRRRVCGVALLCTSAGDLVSLRLAGPFLAGRGPVASVGLAAVTRRPDLVEWGRRLGADASWPLIRTFGFGERRPAPELIDLMDRMIAGTPVQVMVDFLRTLGEHNRFRALVGLRHCRVLVLGGDADRVTPWAHTEALAAALPHAVLVSAPGAGHMAPLEQPDLVNEHVVELLRHCHRTVDPQARS